MSKDLEQYDITFVQEVFDKIDNYLISDIKRILGLRKNVENGDLGYTCLQSIISGMELLGMIYSGKEGDEAFGEFWDEYMSKIKTEYNADLKKVFRNAIRNGTAHFFMTKARISVHRNQGKNLGIQLDPKTNQKHLYINCKELFKDFFKAYSTFKKDAFSDISILNNGLNKLFSEIENGGLGVENYINGLGVTDEMFNYADMPDTSASLTFDRSNLYRLIPISYAGASNPSTSAVPNMKNIKIMEKKDEIED